MTERRVDRIRRILEGMEGRRARVRHVLREVRRVEGNDDIAGASVYIAVNAENRRLEAIGESPLFRTSSSGNEDRGWISLAPPRSFEPESIAGNLEDEVLKANREVNEELRQQLEKMDWRTFEDTFLVRVLEELGFQEVEVTQATRDGGADARVAYKRGIVKARAIVSAKRWPSKAAVSVEEVRMLRGIKGNEDTAIVITTGRFTADAEKEARPSQNQRVVYLIDGKQLVEICKRHEIGVKRHKLPELLVLDEEQFGDEEEGYEDEHMLAWELAQPEAEASTPEGQQVPESPPLMLKRLRNDMLHEISIADLAKITGLSQGTVRTYLSVPERKTSLAKRIRKNEEWRKEVLRLVALARSRHE